ncbi:FadR/GntR family transcriptional regulator [Mangrovibrevibacter kandeliae]|uniref:FadR/GntR family transcriptional regulator n=1 Tax=Mangrovibrevibacter kandeliae TaxID=2968473 RepID=UPI002119B619|nr:MULTISPECIES: FadR/GntR family transcriptional regulator [unclassified Aurantimonas]MCQ8783371.1 FadR family transcriptional regulator [Aurantimonas sp. CSK15Z-1]MCW4116113.1 FadR family transcriptional regulator [Aurantimonas sp. MSK8Z-1]
MGLLQAAIAGSAARSSHAHVVGALGSAIVGGEIAEGALLPSDDALTGRFSVSRTVLREAMKTLAAKGLVRAKAKVGTRVLDRAHWNMFDADILHWRVEAGLDENFLLDLATTRAAIEPAAAALAARRATPADIARLYAIADRLGDLNHDRVSIANVDLEFHLAIAAMSKNPFMQSISSLIEAALAISFKLSSPADDAEKIRECAVNHRRIVEAIERGDEAATRQAMLEVIEVGVERTRRALRQETPWPEPTMQRR